MITLEKIREIPLPDGFLLWGGVLPPPVYLRDGSWLLTLTGSIGGDKSTFGAYIILWSPPSKAVMIGQVSNARSVCTPAENQVFNFAIHNDGTGDKLIVTRINGALPTRDEESMRG